jgi:hypothetical protein
MFDWYTKFVLNASLWTAKVFGMDEEKIAVAQAEADKVIENGTLTGQTQQIYDKYKGVIKIAFWAFIALVAYTFYKRYSKR